MAMKMRGTREGGTPWFKESTRILCSILRCSSRMVSRWIRASSALRFSSSWRLFSSSDLVKSQLLMDCSQPRQSGGAGGKLGVDNEDDGWL